MNARSTGKPFNTPLHEAVLHHADATIKLLLDQNADYSILNNNQCTAVDLLDDIDALMMFIDAGLPVDWRGKDGMTLLHYAVLANDAERVEYLLGKHCLVDAQNINGDTPLHLASFYKLANIVRLLLQSH